MRARIRITLKHGVLDPQGKAIENALASLGFKGINEVRQGKYIEVDLAETDEGKARAGRADLQGLARQLGDRELRLRTGPGMRP
jgi:phosphoribosylformylglycinamidine synthase PurS subunit